MRHARVAALGFLAAVVAFTCLEVGKHLWLDHKAFHEVVGVINYNLQSGDLKLPVAAPPKAEAPGLPQQGSPPK